MAIAPEDTFVPLSAPGLSAGNRPDLRVTVLRQADPKAILALQHNTAPPAAHAQSSCAEPRVTLQHDGDRVASLRVHCACGRIIELACLYDDPPPASSPPPQS